MHPFSDSDTSDSEDGIRFKTQSTRNKETSVKERKRRSPDHRKESRRRRSRSKSRPRHRSRSRDRDRHRHKKHKRDRDRHERQTTSKSYDSSRPGRSHRNVPESSKDEVSEESCKRSGGRRVVETNEGKDGVLEETHKRGCSKKTGDSNESKHRKEERSSDKSKDDVLEEVCRRTSNKQSVETKEKSDNDDSETKETFVKSDESNNSDNAFGPSLPPNILSKDDLESASNIRLTTESTSNVKSKKDDLESPTNVRLKKYGAESSSNIRSQKDNIESNLNVESIPSTQYECKVDDLLTKTSDEKISHESDDSIIGPSLPPHILKSESNASSSSDSNNSEIGPSLPTKNIELEEESSLSRNSALNKDETSNQSVDLILPTQSHLKESRDECIGPTLPPQLQVKESNTIDENIGPSLPLNLRKKLETPTEDDPNFEETDSYGPSLPPNFSKIDEPKRIGPTLPPHLREKLINNEDISEFIEEDEEEEDDDYGPLPVDANPKTSAHLALEERALQMKLDKLNPAENSKPAREEWMMELPAAAARIGLGPRQFRAKEGPDMSDRSSWTDTPLDKEKKKKEEEKKPVDLKEEAELQELKKRDKEQEAIIKDHKKKKKRDKSLLEQHQEKIKKKKEEESSTANVRRPFSRDIDLKVNHFDEAQKKAIFKKAQLLDDRFSKGQSKYL